MNLLEPYNFFFELPLYTNIKIDTNNAEDLVNLLRSKSSIDAYNPILKQESTYVVTKNPSHSISQNYQGDFRNYLGIREFSIQCVRNSFKITVFVNLTIVYLESDQDTIEIYTFTKIGQYPSIADLHISKIREYSHVIPKDKLKEFTKAIGLAANGVGIGSFVYLRRIFESLIEEAHSLAKNEDDWDEIQFERNRMAEKIDQLNHYLPTFLVENKALYSILSKAIHELDENECLQYFEAIKVGIELILDEKVDAYNRKKKLDGAKKKIQQIGQQLNKK